MISQRSQGLYSIFSLVQVLICFAGYWVQWLVVNRLGKTTLSSGRYIVYSVLFAAGLAIEAAVRYGNTSDWYRKSVWRQHALALRQCAFAVTPVLFFRAAMKDEEVSRVFLFSYLGALYLILLLSALTLPQLLSTAVFGRRHLERTLLLGAIPKASNLMKWLRMKSELGLETVGVLSDDSSARFSTLPVLGGTGDLEKIVKSHEVSQVILAEFPFSQEYLSELAGKCEAMGVRFLVLSDLEERFRHPVVHTEIDGLNFFGLRQEPLENPFNRGMKRALDVLVSLPVVLVILPATAVIVWLFQRWQSSGPLFYLQDRSGFQRGTFRIIKFRTMHIGNPSESSQATRGDHRVYPAARWFRMLSIDELPQFINVLRGEMSVVGPRPHLPQHDAEFARALQNYFIRAAVKPGITGLAQVQGFRGEATDPELIRGRIKCDIYYLENWSLLLDVWLILRTALQLSHPPSTAY